MTGLGMAGGPLRVAVWHNFSSGGGKRALYYHVRGLVERGHHVVSFCTPQADQTFLPLSTLVEERVVPLDLREPKPLRVLHRARWRHTVPRIIKKMDAHCRAVADAIGDDFDVVVSTSCQYLAVTPIGTYVRPPSVLYLQEPNRRLYEALRLLPWLESSRVIRAAIRTQGHAELAAIAGYDRVLVNSRFSRESVLRAYGVRSQVCYLGIDTDLFHPPAAPERDYVVGVGSFTPEKNIGLAIEALGRVKPPRPPLVWIGDHAFSDRYVAELEQQANAAGVVFSPRRRVSDEELVALVGGARLMVYSPLLEPFGFAPLEANACGVPVVAGAEGGVREAIADGVSGLLVEPDADALAEGIERLWRNPTEAATLGASAREHVLRSWTLEAADDRFEQHLVAVAAAGAHLRD